MFDQLLEAQALWFTVPASLGTLAFAARLVVSATGRAAGKRLETDDSAEAFTPLSSLSVAAFVGGAGWAGVGALLGMGWEMAPAAAVGVAGGVSMVWLLGLLTQTR